jgi:hypothetical protein
MVTGCGSDVWGLRPDRDSFRHRRVQTGPVVGFCEHGNESSGIVKGGQFPDQPSDCQLHKDSALWNWLDLLRMGDVFTRVYVSFLQVWSWPCWPG